MASLDRRLFARLGSSRLTGSLCGATAGFGTAATNGTARAGDPTDVRFSRLVLLWGTNTKLTNRHLWPFIEHARDDGATVVVIDPIRTVTAEAADWFVQPLPGTDVALMLAMMHVLIRDGLVDADYVDGARHRLRTAGGPRLRLDARARGRRLRARGRRGRAPRPRLRHHPPRVDPDADRRRAPRARCHVLPHPGLPARAHRGMARPGRRAGPQRRLVERGQRRRHGLRRRPPGRRPPASGHQHEPPRPGPDRPRAARQGAGGVEREPAGHRAQRGPHPAGAGARGPLLRRERAVPHRHRSLRRRDLPGRHAARAAGRRAGLGSPLPGLERTGDRAAGRERAEHRALATAGRRAGLHRAGAVRAR